MFLVFLFIRLMNFWQLLCMFLVVLCQFCQVLSCLLQLWLCVSICFSLFSWWQEFGLLVLVQYLLVLQLFFMWVVIWVSLVSLVGLCGVGIDDISFSRWIVCLLFLFIGLLLNLVVCLIQLLSWVSECLLVLVVMCFELLLMQVEDSYCVEVIFGQVVLNLVLMWVMNWLVVLLVGVLLLVVLVFGVVFFLQVVRVSVVVVIVEVSRR